MNLLVSVTVACVLVLACTTHSSAAWTWQRLDHPDSDWTYASGVYGNEIVGTYGAADGIHGFLYDGSAWTTLDYPDSYITYANGVWQDKIVGYYTMPGWEFREAGFLYDGQTWRTIMYPGSILTRAQGVYENRVVGYYEDTSGQDHGFVYDGTQYKSLDYPNVYHGSTYPSGIWGDTIVGYYSQQSGIANGFVYGGEGWTSVHPQDSFSGSLRGISGTTMIGRAQPSFGSSNIRSFLIDGSTWTWIECPWGLERTLVSGISGDRIVGTYREVHGGQSYSFLLTTPEPTTLALLAVAALLIPRWRRP